MRSIVARPKIYRSAHGIFRRLEQTAVQLPISLTRSGYFNESIADERGETMRPVSTSMVASHLVRSARLTRSTIEQASLSDSMRYLQINTYANDMLVVRLILGR